jgi:hypothetical protein
MRAHSVSLRRSVARTKTRLTQTAQHALPTPANAAVKARRHRPALVATSVPRYSERASWPVLERQAHCRADQAQSQQGFYRVSTSDTLAPRGAGERVSLCRQGQSRIA